MSDSDSDSITQFSDDEMDYYSSSDESETSKVLAYEELNQNEILESIDSDVEKFRSQAGDVSKARARFFLQKSEWDVDLALEALNADNEKAAAEKTEVQPMEVDCSATECEVCLGTAQKKDLKLWDADILTAKSA